jgi:hypothetical protein
MTVEQHRRGIFTCLAADTKPPVTQSSFAICIESDTQKIFVTFNNGTAWTQISLAVAQLTGTLGVAAGGTGAATLTGILKGNGTGAITAATPLAVADGGTGAANLNGLQQSSTVRKNGDWWGRGTASIVNADGILTGLSTHITVGTATHTSTLDTTGVYDHASTGATQNSLTGTKASAFSLRGLNTAFSARFNLVQTTATRLYVGFHSNGGTNPASSADVLNTFGGVGLWYDSAVSANWKIVFNNASGSNSTDTTVAAATGIHTLNIRAVDASTKFTFELTGGADAIALQDVTGDIPAQTTALGYWAYVENLTTTPSLIDIYGIHVESDK